MGERVTNRQVLRHKADTLSETEIAEVLDYINIMESLRERWRTRSRTGGPAL